MCLSVPDGYCVVFQCFKVDGYTIRRANGVLSPVSTPNGIFFIILTIEMLLRVLNTSPAALVSSSLF